MRRIALTVLVCEAIAIGMLLAARVSSPPAAPAPQAPPASVSRAEVVAASTGEARPDSAPQPTRVVARAAAGLSQVTVLGVVTDEKGVAIQGAHVFLGGNRSRTSRVESGAYAIVDVPPGDYTLHCRAAGYRPHETQLAVEGSAERLRLDFRLAKATVLNVRFVTPEGEELSQAALGRWSRQIDVIATTEPPPEVFPTDGQRPVQGVGTWRQDERELQLEVDPPVWVSAVVGDARVAIQLASSGDDQVRLVIAPGALDALACTLRLRLVDTETGQPITRGSVSVSSGSRGIHAPLRSQELTLANLRPGPNFLTVSTTDHETLSRALHLQPGETSDLGTLRLARARAVHGRVVDESGRGVPARVRALPLESELLIGPTHRYERDTGPDGSFEAKSLGARAYLLLARTEDGRAGSLRIEASRDDAREVRVVLAPAGRVTLTGAPPPMAAWVGSIADERGHVVFRETLYRRYATTSMLPYGRYVLRVHEGTALMKQRSFTLDRPSLQLEVGR